MSLLDIGMRRCWSGKNEKGRSFHQFIALVSATTIISVTIIIIIITVVIFYFDQRPLAYRGTTREKRSKWD
jgi:hypothetical protein